MSAYLSKYFLTIFEWAGTIVLSTVLLGILSLSILNLFQERVIVTPITNYKTEVIIDGQKYVHLVIDDGKTFFRKAYLIKK